MKKETKIIISLNNLNKLNYLAKKQNISRNKLINNNLRNFFGKRKFKFKRHATILYQKFNKTELNKKFHISFDPDVYDMCLIFKSSIRCSVSLIIAQLITNLFEQKLNINKTDNYLESCKGMLVYKQNIVCVNIQMKKKSKKIRKNKLE